MIDTEKSCKTECLAIISTYFLSNKHSFIVLKNGILPQKKLQSKIVCNGQTHLDHARTCRALLGFSCLSKTALW